MTVAVIFHRLGPYHFARLRAAGRLLRVVAMETSGADETYAWDKLSGSDGFERITLFENADAQKQPAREVGTRVTEALEKIQPQVVVIPGWSDSAALAAFQWCACHRKPIIVMSETTAWDEARKRWKEFIKRNIVRLSSAGLVGGTPHADYLEQLGLARGLIFLGYDAVDNNYFEDKVAEIRKQILETRKQYGLPENYFLASNRFIEKKNLTRLIEAYGLYRKKSEGRNPKLEVWDLVLLGDGALRKELETKTSELGVGQWVHMPGFKQYPELPTYYANAGAFIHASTTEQWGLVVNEAMASSLPVLVSNRCGCARDLVEEGINGFTFDPYNIEQMAELMLRISDFRFPISDFGKNSQRVIADWGPERFADGLLQAVRKALEVGPIQASLTQRLILKTLISR